jgi:hypothetical protein
MDTKFAKYTKKIINALPFWFSIKKKPQEAIGSYFLEVTGLEMDEMEYILNYAYQQTNLRTIDEKFLDIIYKGVLPKYITADNELEVYTESSVVLKYAPTVTDFYLSANSSTMINPELYWDDLYYIDYEHQFIYSKKQYNGTLLMKIDGGEEYEIQLQLHNVWNFFDEFGMLLCTPRLYGENNSEYKQRLLDVFKNKANASKDGLLNGIARELGLRREIMIEDASQPTLITDPMIVLNEIKLNGQFIDLDSVYITEDNFVYIEGNPLWIGTPATISYVSGIEMHTLHNHDDHKLRQRLFNVDNTGTNLLKYYAGRIRSEVPIMWGQWRWNEGYWDIADEDMSGYGYIPNIIDSKITGFKAYSK